MKIRLAGDLQEDSIVDGEGIRTVIWTQGCSHNCKGCHNPETHSFSGGVEVELEEVKIRLNKIKNQQGITLSGGDPFFQAKACSELAKYAKSLGLDVWAYTGFLYEDLLKNKDMKELLENIDVLVDGRFILEKKSYDVIFRGSTNQRIIDVRKSLKENKTIILEKYNKQINLYQKEEGLYI